MAPPRKKPQTTHSDAPLLDDSKADRIRLIVDTDEIVRQAVALRALKLGVSRRHKVNNSEVVNDILREALKAEIAELQQDQSPRRKQRD